MNRQIHHQYPSNPNKSEHLDGRFLDANGNNRSHDLVDEENCWCDPDILEWGMKPNRRMGWVIVKKGTPAQ